MNKRTRRPWPRPPTYVYFGITGLAIVLILAVVGPWLTPHGPSEIVADHPFAPRIPGLPLGADHLGRDLLSRMLHGAGLTVGASIAATVVGFVIGMPIGFLGAELRGWVDDVLAWVIDVFLSYPPLLLALAVVTSLEPSLPVLIGTVGVIHAPRVARVCRIAAMEVAVLDFVDVARARGESTLSILWREIFPSTIRILGVEFGLRLTFSVLFLSSLSFLGLGIQPPLADWGTMVRENMSGLFVGEAAALYPAACIGLLAVSINIVVDWLNSFSGLKIPDELLR